MSEIFHQNEIRTERTLLIIGFSGADKGTSINIRVGRNLMRPSHFFGHLKQNRLETLKGAVDYYCARQIQNGDWPQHLRGAQKYQYFAEAMARTFAQTAARFESDYIFCWMDWDGDNILADGGIIDYGSVRQFGMYYGDYRYDDVDRISSSLPEQRFKARYIVQCFAQIRDFLISGRKKNVHRFRRDAALKIFDEEFDRCYRRSLLEKVGFSEKHAQWLLDQRPVLVRDFQKAFNYFERVRSKKGIYTVPDGLNCDAVFCMRDLLREYPRKLRENGPLNSESFLKLMAAEGAQPKDLRLTPFREHRIAEFQALYSKLVAQVIETASTSSNPQRLLLELMMRSSVINKKDRITGDAAVVVTQNLIRWHKQVPQHTLHEAFRALVAHQQFKPTPRKKAVSPETPSRKSKADAWVERNLRVIRKYCESL
jgi:uncharacterized protein YdiU (UPF0061 family)